MTDQPDWFALVQDRYRVEREIGHGGMAQVYLAEELQHHRPVAIKILLEDLAYAIGHDRFLREVDVAAQLGHPNILPLLDSGTVPATGTHPARPYFVMPFVEGESLKQRMARDPMSLREVLDVVRPVAAALDHAHARGIVHRDVKPANILLTGGTAVVADFGIARALNRSVVETTLTETGLIIGTPAYMSPEQGGTGETVDIRTDIYALGCVVYEMLAGRPPFVADNALAVLARHRLDPPPPLDEARPDLPLGVAAAVHRALAKPPERRFATAGAFADALREAAEQPTGSAAIVLGTALRRHRTAAWIAAGAVVAAGVALAAGLLPNPVSGGGPAVDTTRFAILPVEQADSGHGAIIQGLLRDAFARWSGISVADGFQLREQLERRPLQAARHGAQAASIAQAGGAGRLVRSVASQAGGTLWIEATLFDTRTSTELASRTVTMDTSLGNAQPVLESLADSLLLKGTTSPAALGAAPGTGSGYGTRSIPAMHAFGRGQQALEAWDLAAADSAFNQALDDDGQFTQAALWLALVRSWTGQPTPSWSSAAQQAWSGRDRLALRDRVIAAALVSRANGQMGTACPRWDSLAHASPNDFVNWYGLGDCLASDKAVLRDPASASGWRFRTSYHAALAAYRQAYQLVPSILMALRDRDFQSVRRLYKTSRQDRRIGQAGDGTRFMAAPSWSHDSLALVPWPVAEAAGIAPPRTNIAEAVGHQRELYYQTVSAWVGAYPDNPDVLAALAQAQEMLADPAAISTMLRARRLASTSVDRLRISVAAVALQLKQALPDDTAAMAQAVRLADSLVDADAARDAQDHLKLATLAALTGRTTAALRHLRNPGVGALLDAPRVLSQLGPALELFAALGGPRDSLAAIEGTVRDLIETQPLAADRPVARLRWLARPATLAWPEYVSPLIGQLRGQGDYFLDAIAAAIAGDTAGALAPLDTVAEWRTASGTGPVSVDQLPSLASVYAVAGRKDQAAALLDATLLHLFGTGPDALNEPVRAASLGRSVVLRAEFAAQSGDMVTARRWARALEILWQDADPALQQVLRRIQRLASGQTNAAEAGGSTRRR